MGKKDVKEKSSKKIVKDDTHSKNKGKKKDSKFDADLVLGVEDGKARFSLEFPKKKK